MLPKESAPLWLSVERTNISSLPNEELDGNSGLAHQSSQSLNPTLRSFDSFSTSKLSDVSFSF